MALEWNDLTNQGPEHGCLNFAMLVEAASGFEREDGTGYLDAPTMGIAEDAADQGPAIPQMFTPPAGGDQNMEPISEYTKSPLSTVSARRGKNVLGRPKVCPPLIIRQ